MGGKGGKGGGGVYEEGGREGGEGFGVIIRENI